MLKHITDLIVNWGDKLVITLDAVGHQCFLLVGLVALILYVFGWDNGKKVATLSPAIYVIFEIFMKGWFGV